MIYKKMIYKKDEFLILRINTISFIDENIKYI